MRICPGALPNSCTHLKQIEYNIPLGVEKRKNGLKKLASNKTLKGFDWCSRATKHLLLFLTEVHSLSKSTEQVTKTSFLMAALRQISVSLITSESGRTTWTSCPRALTGRKRLPVSDGEVTLAKAPEGGVALSVGVQRKNTKGPWCQTCGEEKEKKTTPAGLHFHMLSTHL